VCIGGSSKRHKKVFSYTKPLTQFLEEVLLTFKLCNCLPSHDTITLKRTLAKETPTLCSALRDAIFTTNAVTLNSQHYFVICNLFSFHQSKDMERVIITDTAQHI